MQAGPSQVFAQGKSSLNENGLLQQVYSRKQMLEVSEAVKGQIRTELNMCKVLWCGILIAGAIVADCAGSTVQGADVSPGRIGVIPKPMLVEDLPGTFLL